MFRSATLSSSSCETMRFFVPGGACNLSSKSLVYLRVLHPVGCACNAFTGGVPERSSTNLSQELAPKGLILNSVSANSPFYLVQQLSWWFVFVHKPRDVSFEYLCNVNFRRPFHVFESKILVSSSAFTLDSNLASALHRRCSLKVKAMLLGFFFSLKMMVQKHFYNSLRSNGGHGTLVTVINR